jgi:hypothetical protein
MPNLTQIRSITLALCGSLALAISGPALAQHSGGGGGGHGGAAVSGGGGYHGGAYAGGGYRGGYYGGGYRGGYYGGYRGGYYGGGYYGGYRGWYGGYYPWGWGWGGVGLGLYFATLPYYYSTYYYGGVPYYYSNNVYYVYDDSAGQYRTVAPPAGAPAQAGPPGQGGPPSGDLIVYPKNGQSAEQQVRDKYECYQWAVSQLGYDPTSAGGNTQRGNLTDYYRAQTACLEGRGYTVK